MALMMEIVSNPGWEDLAAEPGLPCSAQNQAIQHSNTTDIDIAGFTGSSYVSLHSTFKAYLLKKMAVSH